MGCQSSKRAEDVAFVQRAQSLKNAPEWFDAAAKAPAAADISDINLEESASAEPNPDDTLALSLTAPQEPLYNIRNALDDTMELSLTTPITPGIIKAAAAAAAEPAAAPASPLSPDKSALRATTLLELRMRIDETNGEFTAETIPDGELPRFAEAIKELGFECDATDEREAIRRWYEAEAFRISQSRLPAFADLSNVGEEEAEEDEEDEGPDMSLSVTMRPEDLLPPGPTHMLQRTGELPGSGSVKRFGNPDDTLELSQSLAGGVMAAALRSEQAKKVDEEDEEGEDLSLSVTLKPEDMVPPQPSFKLQRSANDLKPEDMIPPRPSLVLQRTNELLKRSNPNLNAASTAAPMAAKDPLPPIKRRPSALPRSPIKPPVTPRDAEPPPSPTQKPIDDVKRETLATLTELVNATGGRFTEQTIPLRLLASLSADVARIRSELENKRPEKFAGGGTAGKRRAIEHWFESQRA